MSQELYYTSAPEGLYRGSGFCTVGVTEGLPKPLIERLEQLSTYRHHFEAGSGRENPVCLAHWTLHLGGREYHVLSRICDSGMDYTQRTNAFAHHLVLEEGELAGAGPAWMLGQAGTMMRQWDGNVGTIMRAGGMPRGDSGPGVCGAWERMTGDAGWGGVLAESMSKSPVKPVCLLFDPGQDLLPLMDEAIRLLPGNRRWSATFSTYFTSLPGSATCGWRCCLAGTPAARQAARGGVVLDLTKPGKMGAAPASAWVDAARSGVGVEGRRDTGAALNVVKGKPRAVGPVRNFKRKVEGIVPLMDEADEIGAPIEIDFSAEDAAAAAADGVGVDFGMPGLEVGEAVETKGKGDPGQVMVRRPKGMERKERVLGAVGVGNKKGKGGEKKPWQRVAVIYLLACLLIGIGTVLSIFVIRWGVVPAPSTPTDDPPGVKHTPVKVNVGDAGGDTGTGVAGDSAPKAALPTVAMGTGGGGGVDDPPAVVKAAALPSVPAGGDSHAGTQIAMAIPEVAIPKVVAALPAAWNKTVTLNKSLAMGTGAGTGNVVTAAEFDPKDFDDLGAIAGLSVLFPGNRKTFVYRQKSLSGTLVATTGPTGGAGDAASAAITWKDATDGADAPWTTLATVGLDRVKNEIEVTWNGAAMIKDRDAAALAYWVLQNSTILGSDAGETRAQKIRFKAVDVGEVVLDREVNTILLPVEVPAEATLAVVNLDPGWRIKTASWWEDGADEGTAGGQMVEIRPPMPGSGEDERISLKVAADWGQVASDYGEELKELGQVKANLKRDETDEEAAIQTSNDDFKKQNDAYDVPGAYSAAQAEELKAELGKKHDDEIATLEGELSETKKERGDYDRIEGMMKGAGFGLEMVIPDAGSESPEGLRIGEIQVKRTDK